SYLSYIRDRLLIARELLTESGSCFVQISDENVHLVRVAMDEVFGSGNFVSQINFQSMTPLESGRIENVFDYILCYAKDKDEMKYRNLYAPKKFAGNAEYKFIETQNGDFRELTNEEKAELDSHPEKNKIFKRSVLESSGFTQSCTFPFEFDGKTYNPRGGK